MKNPQSVWTGDFYVRAARPDFVCAADIVFVAGKDIVLTAGQDFVFLKSRGLLLPVHWEKTKSSPCLRLDEILTAFGLRGSGATCHRPRR